MFVADECLVDEGIRPYEGERRGAKYQTGLDLEQVRGSRDPLAYSTKLGP